MAKDKITKTNAARLLDQAKIGYELISYAFDEDDLSAPHVPVIFVAVVLLLE